MIVGCYSMDLYCDNDHKTDGTAREYQLAKPGQYTGHTEADCKRDARKEGWKFKRNGKVYCPACPK